MGKLYILIKTPFIPRPTAQVGYTFFYSVALLLARREPAISSILGSSGERGWILRSMVGGKIRILYK